MKKIVFIVLFLMAFSVSLFANSAPVVSDVTAQQRDDGSMKVDIYYDVYDADGDEMTIFMQVSDDDGATWDISCNLISGDEGTGIYSGNNKHITWNVGAEHPNMQGDDFRFKIIAMDGGTGTVTDIDGNVYQTIIIGDQEWMAENLKVTHYRNGEPIPHLTDNNDWTSTSSGAYCYYNNDPSNGTTYGALYNWFTVDDNRNIAPAGWHVPTDAELTQLTNFLGSSAGSKLAGGYDLWQNGALRNDPEFDTSGFSFLPGGYRHDDGLFYSLGGTGHFWSATESYAGYAWDRSLRYGSTQVLRSSYYKQLGFSVRCLRD